MKLISPSLSPFRAQMRLDHRVVSMGAGEDFTVLVTPKGAVFACGTNVSGELGEATEGPSVGRIRPTLALQGRDILSVVCGSRHVVALGSTGKAYVWGLNTSGQLGLGHRRPIVRPTELSRPVDAPEFSSWVEAAAGVAHTLWALRPQGGGASLTVYSSGNGAAGCLGHGEGAKRGDLHRWYQLRSTLCVCSAQISYSLPAALTTRSYSHAVIEYMHVG